MLHVIVSSDIVQRQQHRKALITEADVVVLDDTTADALSLESYLYPSLFSLAAPVVHGRFLLEGSPSISPERLRALVDSPTLFVLEEMTLATPLKKTLEKVGATLHVDVQKKEKEAATIFAVTNAITAANKKDRWLAYQGALEQHPPEALIGILYWKLRQLIDAQPKKTEYRTLYRALIRAHARAWGKGFSLALAIEKVILAS